MVRTYIKSNGGLVEPHANGNVSNPSVVCFSRVYGFRKKTIAVQKKNAPACVRLGESNGLKTHVLAIQYILLLYKY